MPWTYQVGTGYLIDPSNGIKSKGYSGQPPHTNKTDDENLEGLGPIPRGTWTATELIENHPKLGEFVIVLEPDGETRLRVEAMGRNPDSFRMHGERLAPPPGYASDGCMVQPRFTREAFWRSADHQIEVV